MNSSPLIRMPSEHEYGRPYHDLLKTMLDRIRVQLNALYPFQKVGESGSPVNICLYTAFPATEWGFDIGNRFNVRDSNGAWKESRHLEMNIWVLNDPYVKSLQSEGVGRESLDKLEEKVLILRPILTTGHWNICPMIVPEGSKKDRKQMFEFTYTTCEGSLLERLEKVRSLKTDAGEWLSLETFQPLNELDDFVLTQKLELCKAQLTLSFARIPCLSTPLAFIALRKGHGPVNKKVDAFLWSITGQIRPTLALYSQALFRQYLYRVANYVDLQYWESDLDKIIPTLIGIAISSVLMPIEVKIYSSCEADEPYLTVSIKEENLPPNGTYSTKAEILKLNGFDSKIRCKFEVTFFDHGNPYIDRNAPPDKIRTGSEEVPKASNSDYYASQLEIFTRFLEYEVESLESFAEMKKSQRILSTLNNIATGFKSLTQDLVYRLDATKYQRATRYELSNIRQKAQSITRLSGKHAIVNGFKDLGQRGGKTRYDSFINELELHYTKHPNLIQSAFIRHVFKEADASLTGSFSRGIFDITGTAFQHVTNRPYDILSLVRSLQGWLCRLVKVTEEGREYCWPLLIPPPGEIAKTVLESALRTAMGDYEVEAKNEAYGVDMSGIDIPTLCFICEVLFISREERWPRDNKISVEYDEKLSTWSLEWTPAFAETWTPKDVRQRYDFIDLAENPRTITDNTVVSGDRLETRLWFLNECYGFLEGGISYDAEKKLTRMEWVSNEIA